MIETYKILTGVYDSNANPQLQLNTERRTRDHSMRLNNYRTKYDLRKYFWTNRIVNIWNSLPEEIVGSTSVNLFKNRLDKFWTNQELMYDFKADLTGIGNRSNLTSI
jgi:hypothetical protein